MLMGVKDQTCHCTNENEAQKAVRWERHLIGFHNPTLDTTPSQDSQQASPCSGILQIPEPAPPLALSPCVTCFMVSSGDQARSKSRKWPMATNYPGSRFLRAQLESRHCLSFLNNMGRAGHLFVPQFPNLLSGNNVIPQRVIGRV